MAGPLTAAADGVADRTGSVGSTLGNGHVLRQPLSRGGTAFSVQNLVKDLLGLEALQPIEIPQNRQRNLWKGLEQNSLDLERLAKSLEVAVTAGPVLLCADSRPLASS
jgi:hypothetical protein